MFYSRGKEEGWRAGKEEKERKKRIEGTIYG